MEISCMRLVPASAAITARPVTRPYSTASTPQPITAQRMFDMVFPVVLRRSTRRPLTGHTADDDRTRAAAAYGRRCPPGSKARVYMPDRASLRNRFAHDFKVMRARSHRPTDLISGFVTILFKRDGSGR